MPPPGFVGNVVDSWNEPCVRQFDRRGKSLREADLEGFLASLEMTARIESTALTFVGAASSRDEILMPSIDAHQRDLRKGRFSQCGYWYLITTGTKGRLPMLSDPAASRIVMDCLKWLKKQGRIDLTAAVIMPDHIHFVARLLSTTLPSLMHSLKSFTSNKINEKLGGEGPLWKPQYHDHAIRTDDELKECVSYCLHNPVRKGLDNHFKDYPHWYCAYEA